MERTSLCGMTFYVGCQNTRLYLLDAMTHRLVRVPYWFFQRMKQRAFEQQETIF